MRPAEIIPDTPERNWCLAAGDDTFLVYALEGGAFRVDLTGAQGPYLAQWFDPRTGALTKLPSTVPGRAVAHFPAPDQQDWALLLRRSE